MLEQRAKDGFSSKQQRYGDHCQILGTAQLQSGTYSNEILIRQKEFICMRDDHKVELKKIKQQILSFCLRQGYQYDGSGN